MAENTYIHGYLQYNGRGSPANNPPPPEYLLTQHSCKDPLNISSHNTAARRPPHPSYTQQHTTTLHNSTRVHKTTNVPVVFMALIWFWGVQHHYSGHWKGWALKISTFLGPEMARKNKHLDAMGGGGRGRSALFGVAMSTKRRVRARGQNPQVRTEIFRNRERIAV